MATAVLQKPAEKTGTWSAIFPNEQVTETQSALFVKKLLAVAVSNIAYLRAIFPEHAFGDRSLEGLNLKILRDDISCPGASQVIKWVKGCFDAFDNKYLRMLMIGLYVDPEDPDTVIESYTFKFSYFGDGGIDIYRNDEKISGAHTAEETRKATIRLLRTVILLTQTLDSLPDDVMMTMKLLYYDEVTPEDYEPPGFKAADEDNFAFEEEPMTIKVGDVGTAYHCVKVRVKTNRGQFELPENQTQEQEDEVNKDKEINTGLDDDVLMQQIDQEADEEATELVSKEPSQAAHIPELSPTKPDEVAFDAAGSEASQHTDVDESFKVRCPCGCNEDDGLMIMCAVCKLWQHGVCFLVVDEDNAPEVHVCDVCAVVGDKDKEPTDYYLVDLSPIEVQATCLWRRALVACLDLKRVLAPVLAKRLGTDVTVAQGLINRLIKEGFIKSLGKGKRLGKVVDKEKITSVGLPKYMKKRERPIIVEKQDTQSQVHEEMESLTEQTQGLKINGKKDKLSRKKKRQAEKENTKPVSESATDADVKRKGRKRAVSKRDDAQEFEIATQELYEDEPRKRKKASVVSKDIMV